MAQDAGACRLDFAEVVGSYSGLNLNQYSVASPCPDLNLIHYNLEEAATYGK
ncbi:predicted protein [Neisseria gonorrhoeae PID332]|nr:predicted protein [Neisseria gonorrhoeae PID332]